MDNNHCLILITALTLAASQLVAVEIDGHCYLENQTNHQDTQVIFVIDSTSQIADTAITDDTGYYLTDLGEGVYDIYYSHHGYAPHGIHHRPISQPTTLEDITLPELPPGVYLSGPVSGTLETNTYLVEDSVVVDSAQSLTIQPGTIFLFLGYYEFEIYGLLNAVGTETDSIWFKPASTTVPWKSIIFRQGSDSNSVVSYCHVTGARGSGLNTYWTSITITHCTFDSNNANWGGGIYVSHANPSILDCIITNNTSVYNGGGIYCTGASPTIVNCIVTGNECSLEAGGSGRGGGGICGAHLSSPIIQQCTITGNISNENGGGISMNDNCNLQITGCVISDNEAADNAGGIFCGYNCNPVIKNCNINNNIACFGGGVYLDRSSTLTADSCQINANTADTLGGGIHVFNSKPSFNRCTVAFNSAPDPGGGIYAFNSSLDLIHCTFSHNDASVGGNAFFAADSLDTLFADTLINTVFAFAASGEGIYLDTASQNITIAYCDIFGNAAGHFAGFIPDSLGLLVTTNHNGDSCDVFSNIFLDPQFLNPPAWDFHLLAASSCIDAGDPSFAYDPDTTIADIGAHFYDQSIPHLNQPNSTHPNDFQLYPNYPNPFNATTVLTFSLPIRHRVNISVFNTLGQRITTLVNRHMDPGYHRVIWYAQCIPTGMYFVQMTAGDFRQARKVVLLK